jgi:Fe-S-cluster formation regulator IscX/YfhJ
LKRIPGLQKVFLSLNDFESDPAKFAELQQIIVDLEKKSVKVK